MTHRAELVSSLPIDLRRLRRRAARGSSRHLAARLFDSLVRQQVWVAAAAASLTIFTTESLGAPPSWLAAGTTFFAALLIYNFDRWLDALVEPGREGGETRADRRQAISLVLGSALLLIVLLARSPVGARALVVAGGALCLLYGVPLFARRRGWGLRRMRLKDVPGLKSLWVAAAISTAVVFLPLAHLHRAPGFPEGILLVLLLVFVYSNVTMFDLRDSRRDRVLGSSTEVVRHGEQTMRRVILRLNVITLAGLAGLLVLGAPGLTAAHFCVPLLPVAYAGMPVGEGSDRRLDFVVDGSVFLLPLLAAVVAFRHAAG